VALSVLAVGLTASLAIAREPVKARRGMVVSVSPSATAVGREVLQQGGNAVDAGVATALALAVTFPEAGNIGGGGFMVVHPACGGEPVVIDYREAAPQAATRERFATLDSRLGHKAVGVPGTVHGLALAHRRFGALPWKSVVTPAVRLAQDGFVLDANLAASLNRVVAASPSFAELCRVYGKEGGRAPWAAGDRLLQPDLATTLRRIAEEGADAFYRGAIAVRIADEMKEGGGLITKADLAAYRAVIRKPLCAAFRGYDVYCPPAPSGGVVLVEMLNCLENFDLKKQGRWSPATVHLMIEAMRLAYFDRACYLGDPDFVEIPDFLISKAYSRTLARRIDPHQAASSEALAATRHIVLAPEGRDTTHFSIIDESGLAVANTYTLERSYGSRVVVRGAGFLLNNEMGDFGWRPGHTDRSGVIGTEPNLIEPGKRMLSSQTPTIVAKDGRAVLLVGSPGGRTIINTVLQILLNVLEFDMELTEAVDCPRFHHQWLPDRVVFEKQALASNPGLRVELSQLGHQVGKSVAHQGDAHSIWVDWQSGEFHGVADLRRNGCARGY
jgi:gamma-glutamyltranspeptidase/glutathione hydrolase